MLVKMGEYLGQCQLPAGTPLGVQPCHVHLLYSLKVGAGLVALVQRSKASRTPLRAAMSGISGTNTRALAWPWMTLMRITAATRATPSLPA